VLLTVSTPNSIDTTWVRKYRPHRVTMDGTLFELAYQNKSVPLGFSLTLNRFRIGYYPGENRPRSFESHVTITDPVTGRTLSRVISMNSPVKYGRYSLFQSSYHTIGERTMSVLGVSRDPGQAIVYTGYIGMMAGMLIVLGTRITDRRRQRRS
jgi:cytochrome c biogenesis protein ResB